MTSVFILTGNATRAVVDRVWGKGAYRAHDAHELRALVTQARQVTVILGDDLTGLPALNIASVLHLNNPHCTILLVVQSLSHDMKDRARKAGVTRVYDLGELQNNLLSQKSSNRPENSRCDAPSIPLRSHQRYLPQRFSREGVLQVVEEPVLSVAPARDLRPVQQRGVSAEHKRLSCPCVAVLSAQGGVGKSTIATALSAACSQQITGQKSSGRQQVALVDLDAQFPVIPALIGLAPQRGLDSLLNLRKDPAEYIDHAFTTLFPGLSYALGALRPEYADKVWAHAVELLAAASTKAQLLVVNLPKVWNECSASAVERADMILLICRECAGDVATLKQALALLQRLGIERTKIVVVINKSQRKKRDQTFVNRLKASVGAYPVLVVQDGGVDVDRLAQEGLLLNIFKTENRFAGSVADLSRQLIQTLGLNGEGRLQTHVFASARSGARMG